MRIQLGSTMNQNTYVRYLVGKQSDFSECEKFFPKCLKSNLVWGCILYFKIFCRMVLISEHSASN